MPNQFPQEPNLVQRQSLFYPLLGILVFLIFLLGFILVFGRYGKFWEKGKLNFAAKTETQATPIKKVLPAFSPDKASEITSLIEKGDQETDIRLKYSAYQSAWNRMLAVYYYAGRKPEQKKALEQLKEVLKGDPLYKEDDYLIQ